MGLTFNLGRVSPSVFTDSSLNVGIGAAPSGTYKLEVTGTAKVSTSAYFAIASGSVGIGTITPTSYFYTGNGLAIYNATQNTLSIATDTSGTSSLYFSNGASGAARYNGYLEYIHSTNSMTFGTGGFTRLTIASTGAATFSSSVTSGSEFISYTGITMDAGGGTIRGGLTLNYSTGEFKSFCGVSGNSYFQTFNTNGSLRMTIASNGNIGAPSGSNIYNASDIRLKQNIETIENGLDKIIALNPVKFNWIDGFEPNEDGKDMLGFIAQEVNDIIPEAVENFGGNSILVNDIEIVNPLRVNEKFIIPVLVKAIQELSAQNQDLKSRLDKAGL